MGPAAISPLQLSEKRRGGGHRWKSAGMRRGEGVGGGSIFKALFACCSVPVCVNGGGRVIREPGWAALRAAPRHKDDTV